jgi:hypothetical protein
MITLKHLRICGGSKGMRLYITDLGSAIPKDMSIAEACLGMTGGYQTDASLFTVMVRGFTATHRSKDYIPRES